MLQKKMVITGATGNIGSEVIKKLDGLLHNFNVVAAVNNKPIQTSKSNIEYVHFDFYNPYTFKKALINCEILFLLRPPQIVDIKQCFVPLIKAAKANGVLHIVFLSIQGVENNKSTPHYKIEQLIKESGLRYTFIRPAYFMQNFTTILKDGITKHHEIYLPAGNTLFTLVDIADVGNVVANVLVENTHHINRCYNITSNDLLNFKDIAKEMSSAIGEKINYVSPNLLSFFFKKLSQKMSVGLILVLIQLHFMARFKKTFQTSNYVLLITGKQPTSLKEFFTKNSNMLKGRSLYSNISPILTFTNSYN
jgi:uncharacterized protein YbjT (DUF2867 family)